MYNNALYMELLSFGYMHYLSRKNTNSNLIKLDTNKNITRKQLSGCLFIKIQLV